MTAPTRPKRKVATEVALSITPGELARMMDALERRMRRQYPGEPVAVTLTRILYHAAIVSGVTQAVLQKQYEVSLEQLALVVESAVKDGGDYGADFAAYMQTVEEAEATPPQDKH